MIKSLKITNQMTNESIIMDWDGSDCIVLDTIDWGYPVGEFITYKLPKQIGSELSGVSVGTSSQNITGYVISKAVQGNYLGLSWSEYWKRQESDIEETKERLNKIINPFQDVRIEIEEYYLDARPSIVPKYAITEKENNEAMCFFSIDFFCLDPMFKRTGGVLDVLSGVKKMFVFPWRIKKNGNVFGSIASRKLTSVENKSDCAVGMVVTIRSTFTDVVNPRIYEVKSGYFIELNVTIGESEYIVINTNKGKESMVHYRPNADGVTFPKERSVFPDMVEGSTFLQLEQGTSMIGWTADTGESSMSVSIEFEEKKFRVKGM